MIARLRALFRRYASMHMFVTLPARPISDAAEQLVGYIDRIEVSQGYLNVSGWLQADRITLVLAGGMDTAIPSQRREDVAQAMGIDPQVGFSLSLPCHYETLLDSAAPGLRIARAEGAAVPEISLPFSGSVTRRERWRMFGAFWRDVTRALPAILRWAVTRNYLHRAAVKRTLGLDPRRPAGQLDPAIFALENPLPLPQMIDALSIVLPVYNGFDLLQEVLDRVVRNTDPACRLILIEDASPDPAVRPFLRDFVEKHRAEPNFRIELIENQRNLGFVGSVNAGIDLALAETGGGPVVLLNSDALVPPGWACRLVAPLVADPDVASTTPMTSDGEIVSVPVICQAISLAPGQVDAIDAWARRLNPAMAPVDMPTGVGFCMAISRDWLKRVPRFDTAFGRGYGEEVDWCQKTRALGGRHLAVPGLFVEHAGGASFGSAEKAERIATNNAIIARRYPGFDADVQGFIANDPLHGVRLALGLAWAGSRGTPVAIYLAHAMGGGAQHDLDARIADDLETGVFSVVLRVGGRQRWQIELITPDGQISGTTDSDAVVHQFLEPVENRRIVYSCGVGDPDPIRLPGFLRSLKRHADDRIEVHFHDFFPLSPSYTLLGSDGIYRGPPIAGETTDPGHVFRRANRTQASLSDWQSAWHDLAVEAETLLVFSQDSAAQVAAVWPDLRDRIAIRPHRLLTDVPRIAPPAALARPVIGVLGNIGYQKGARLLQDLAARLVGENRIGLVLIGNIDPNFRLPDNMPVLGSYQPRNIATLARKHAVTHWLIPSIWPETFSYTTHEALATGLPVLAFDIGAQGEAVGAAGNGHPMRFDPDGDWVATVVGVISELTGET